MHAIAAGAQGAGRCPCCRQLVHLLFQSISTFVNPADEGEKPVMVVQPMSISSLLDEIERTQPPPARRPPAGSSPHAYRRRAAGASPRQPAFPALRSAAASGLVRASGGGGGVRWFDATDVGGEAMRVAFARREATAEGRASSGEEWSDN